MDNDVLPEVSALWLEPLAYASLLTQTHSNCSDMLAIATQCVSVSGIKVLLWLQTRVETVDTLSQQLLK